MKKFAILSVLILATITASAMNGTSRHRHRHGPPNSIGAPLDGGLLLLLGGAGVAYYVAKKNKNITKE